MRRTPAVGWSLAAGAMAAWVVLAASSSRAGEDAGPKSVRLLVSCDDVTKPKVLAALAALDVTVHDLATMQPIATKQAPAAPPQTILPVRRIVEALGRAMEGLQAAGEPPSDLRAIEVSNHTALVRVRVPRVEALDALEAALGGNPLIQGAAIRRGAIRATGDRFETEIAIQFFAPHQAFEAPAPADLQSLPVAAIKEAATRAGGRLDAVSAQQVERDASGELVSADVDLTVPAAIAVQQLLDRLDEVPGVRVSGLGWRAVDKDSDYKVRIRLSMRRGR